MRRCDLIEAIEEAAFEYLKMISWRATVVLAILVGQASWESLMVWVYHSLLGSILVVPAWFSRVGNRTIEPLNLCDRQVARPRPSCGGLKAMQPLICRLTSALNGWS
ncbi:hypothetical protein NKDENANG_01247 [Candidatus Entotheonellaceae bacterium PAL068K]